MNIKIALIVLTVGVLTACGASEDGTSVSISPDLTVTMKVDDAAAEGPGFVTTIGQNGASIALNSGQRLEIGSDTPVVFDVDMNGATASDTTVTPFAWNGVITSATGATVRFRISSVADPDKAGVIEVNVAAPR